MDRLVRRLAHALQRLGPLVLGRPHPLQRRVTALTMLAVALTVGATCLTGWLALRATLFDISERGSLLIAQDLAPIAADDLQTEGRLDPRVLGAGTTVVLVVGAAGTVLSVPGEDTSLVVGRPEVTAAQQQERIVRNTTSSTGEVYRLVAVPLQQTGYVLVVGRPLTSSYEVLRVFGLVVLTVGSVGLLWAWLLGRTVARTALAPVRRFVDAVQHVAETEDLDPLPVADVGGDLATLTASFNEILRRLATSRNQQNQLITDASHELRTPLTSVRTNVELLVLDAGRGRIDEARRTAMLGEVLAQTVELSALITDLVHLARERSSTIRDPLDLCEVVLAAVERVRHRAAGLTFEVELGSLPLLGDAANLEHAVANLLDNAVSWSPPGGTVRVRLDERRLQIGDDGPGIAAADLPYVFDRFYRAASARSVPGSGLGLSVATKTVAEHGGTITAGSGPNGGALFVVDFPPVLPPVVQTAAPAVSARRAPARVG